MPNMLNVTSSPHLRHSDTTSGIMLDVIFALMPATIFGCILFRLSAVLLILVCVGTAVLAEYLWNKALKKENTIFDLSAVVTGLLLGLNLSPAVPLWIAAIGSVVAIIVVKQMFGGIGHNFANPAITARIVLLVSFPSFMTTYKEPLMDAMTGPTPLAAESGTYTVSNLFWGVHSGAIGETSTFLLLCGGAYLVLRRVISPIIPLCFIGTVAFTTLISGGNPLVAILSGGVMLGAIFMATDYSTSPTTNWGKVIFGVGAGLITFVIRRFGALPEGVSYAILIMNILVPYINKATLKKPFGYVKGGNK